MSAAPDRHRVAVMVIPGVLALDFGIPAQVFAEDPHYDLVVCAETGSPVSSSGVTAGVDLCLHLIRTDHGAAAANSRSRALVAPPNRAGDQAQYIEKLLPQANGSELAQLRDWMLDNLAQPLSLDALAQQAHMSR